MFSIRRKAVAVAFGLWCLSTSSLCAMAAGLSDTVEQALKSHPLVMAGKAAVDAADKSYDEQKAAYFPVVSVDGRYGRVRANDDNTRASTGGAAMSWVGEGNVVLTQPIYAGFGTVNRVQAAEDRKHSAAYEVLGTEDDVSLHALRAHLNLMRTKELLDLANKFYSEMKARKQSIDAMLKEGAVNEAESFQAADLLMSVTNLRLGYQDAFQQAEADYVRDVGKEPDAMLEFGAPVWDSAMPQSIKAASTLAQAKNAKILAAKKLLDAAYGDVNAAHSDYMPRLNAEVSYNKKDQRQELSGETEYAQGMLKLNWDFSIGGAQNARVQKAAAQQNQASARLQSTQRDVEHDIRQKFTSIGIIDEEYKVLMERERAAKAILDSGLAQFEGGKQSNLQIVGMYSKYFDSAAARTDAYYRRMLARFELLNAVGVLRETMTGHGAIKADSSDRRKG